MNLFFALAAFAVGLLIPFQALINSKLNVAIGNPMAAALISFAGGFGVFLIVNIFSSAPLPSFSKISGLPPYLLIGGLIGAVFIISAIFLVPKLGATAWVALLVTGQLIMSLILDHYGALGVPLKQINLIRVAGAILLLTGSSLIVKF